MGDTREKAEESLLIQPAELANRLQANEIATIVDVRNLKPWSRGEFKVRGALRIDPAQLPLDPTWPADQLLVFY